MASTAESKAVGASLPTGGRQFWNDIFQSYGLMAMCSEQHGNVFAKLNNGNLSGTGSHESPAKLTRSLAGLANFNADASIAPNYWSGGFVAELGLTDRIQAMTRQRSSDVLIIPPKGGIGPTTTSCFTRW